MRWLFLTRVTNNCSQRYPPCLLIWRPPRNKVIFFLWKHSYLSTPVLLVVMLYRLADLIRDIFCAKTVKYLNKKKVIFLCKACYEIKRLTVGSESLL